MTLKECYEAIGSDFAAAVKRMGGSEKMLMKFVNKFPNDPTYGELEKTFDSGDLVTAFRMAHTLKGLCLNLGFDTLQASSAALTEALRHEDNIAPNAAELYEKVKADYAMTIGAIKAIDPQT